MKQCPKCSGNLADFVEVCPYCGTATPLKQVPQFAPQLHGSAPQASGAPENSGKALASLICGVVFLLWPLSAIVAIILGHLALADIKKSAGRLTGRPLAIGGLVTGYVATSVVFLLIFAAIVIPNVLRAKMAANEASAVGTLRSYNTALVSYAAECPNQGYPPALNFLGPGAPTADKCTRANLLEAALSKEMPVKYGYRFYYAAEGYDRTGHVVKYALAADPVNPGATGVRHFYTDESGVIRFSRRGAADAHSQTIE